MEIEEYVAFEGKSIETRLYLVKDHNGHVIYSAEDIKRAQSFIHGIEWASKQVARFAVELGVLSPEEVQHV